MYAVFQISGFQFRGEQGTVLKIPRQSSTEGEKLGFSDVLLVKKGDNALIGTPFVEGAKVEAEVIRHGKEDKVTIYKYRRRTKYRRTQGHRQGFTEIKISNIVTP